MGGLFSLAGDPCIWHLLPGHWLHTATAVQVPKATSQGWASITPMPSPRSMHRCSG